VHLRPGDTFGRYTIEALLGEGGMGTVYRAVDTKLERRVALKLLRVDVSVDPAGRASGAERMLREARAAAAIEHANAVAIHDVGEVDDTPYIAMELVVGRSLRTLVGDTTIATTTQLRWLMDVARALGAAHARGLVHRDVKPDNVMVREDGTVKVLDFGIAWIQGASRAPSDAMSAAKAEVPPWYVMTLTMGGRLVGTPRYMAPEQLRGESVDGRADQFAWAVMAYELIAGVPPWRGSQVSLTMLADVLENDPAPMRSVAPNVPRDVERIVMRGLSKDPEARYPTMAEVVAALEQSLARRVTRTRWTVGLAAAATVAVVGAGGVGFARLSARHPPPTPSTAGSQQVATFSSSMLESSAEPPHVVLHLDASQGVSSDGDKVSRWADQSGNDNDAKPGRRAPTLVPGAIHGRAAVHLDGGAYLVVPDSQTLHLGTADFTVEVVARYDRPSPSIGSIDYGITTGYGALYVKSEASFPFRGVSLFANYPRPVKSTRLGVQTQYGHFVLSDSEHVNDGAVRLLAARRVRDTLEVRVNGVAEARFEGASDDVTAPGVPIHLGAHETQQGVIQQVRGDVAEVVVIQGPIEESRLAELEGGLMGKYGIAGAGH
jgi:serine/threonine-protein kinase